MKYLFLLLWRQALPLFLLPVLFVGLCFVYFVIATPIYSSSALMRVETEAIVDPKELDAVLSSHIETIESDAVTELVLNRLEPEPGGNLEPGFLNQTIADLRQKYGFGTVRELTEDERRTLLTEWIREDLTVKRVKETSILEIRYSALSPERAAQVANSYADAFVEYQAGLVKSGLQQKLTFVQQRMRDLRGSIESSQSAARQIKTAEGKDPGRFQNLENRISQLAQQLSGVDQIRAGLAEQIAILREPDDLKSLEAAASKVEGGRQLFQTYFGLLQSLDRQPPDGASGSSPGQLVAATEELHAELVRIRDQALVGLEQEYQVTVAQRDALARDLQDANTLINSSEWLDIRNAEFDAVTLQAIYADYQREIEAAWKAASDAPVTLMTRARTDPNPTWPDYKILLLLSGCAGLGLGCVIAYLRELNRADRQRLEAQTIKGTKADIVPLMEVWSELDNSVRDDPAPNAR